MILIFCIFWNEKCNSNLMNLSSASLKNNMARNFDEIISDIYQNKILLRSFPNGQLFLLLTLFVSLRPPHFKLRNINLAVVIFAFIMNSNPRLSILIILRNANSHQNLLWPFWALRYIRKVYFMNVIWLIEMICSHKIVSTIRL